MPLCLQDHLEKCPKVTVHCRHIGCPRVVRRENLDTHEDSCTFRVIRCVEFGCDYECKAAEMEKHAKESVLEHFQALKEAHSLPDSDVYATCRKIVTVTVPADFAGPTPADRNDSEWAFWMESPSLMAESIEFTLDSYINNKDLFKAGLRVTDGRVHSCRAAYAFRLLPGGNPHSLFRWTRPIYVEMVREDDDTVQIVELSLYPASSHLLDPFSGWTLEDEDGDKTVSIEVKLYIHDLVFSSDVGEDAPEKTRMLSKVGILVDGEPWHFCLI